MSRETNDQVEIIDSWEVVRQLVNAYGLTVDRSSPVYTMPFRIKSGGRMVIGGDDILVIKNRLIDYVAGLRDGRTEKNGDGR